jgi:hypothetical protein
MDCKNCAIIHICNEMGPDLSSNCFVPKYNSSPKSQCLSLHHLGDKNCSFCDFPPEICECGGVIHNELNLLDGTLKEICDNDACIDARARTH